MSKTTPVRWWRDDATRYRSRPPYKAPAIEGPMFAPIPLSPEIAEAYRQAAVERDRQIARLAQWAPQDSDPIKDICRALAVPPEILGRR